MNSFVQFTFSCPFFPNFLQIRKNRLIFSRSFFSQSVSFADKAFNRMKKCTSHDKLSLVFSSVQRLFRDAKFFCLIFCLDIAKSDMIRLWQL